MAEIPEEYHDLFEKQTFAHFASLMPDGAPHAVPVWVGYDGEHLLVNTTDARRKTRNVENDPRVAVSMVDPDDPYRSLNVQGEVVEVTEDGAVEHINELTQRYMGQEEYPNLGDEEGARVIVKVRPDNVMG